MYRLFGRTSTVILERFWLQSLVFVYFGKQVIIEDSWFYVAILLVLCFFLFHECEAKKHFKMKRIRFISSHVLDLS